MSYIIYETQKIQKKFITYFFINEETCHIIPPVLTVNRQDTKCHLIIVPETYYYIRRKLTGNGNDDPTLYCKADSSLYSLVFFSSSVPLSCATEARTGGGRRESRGLPDSEQRGDGAVPAFLSHDTEGTFHIMLQNHAAGNKCT
jgi:hypothetical protein